MQFLQKCYDWLLENLRNELEQKLKIPMYFYHKAPRFNNVHVVIGEQKTNYHFLLAHKQADCRLELQIWNIGYRLLPPINLKNIVIYNVFDSIVTLIHTLKNKQFTEDSVRIHDIRCENLQIQKQQHTQNFVGIFSITFAAIQIQQNDIYDKDLSGLYNVMSLDERYEAEIRAQVLKPAY